LGSYSSPADTLNIPKQPGLEALSVWNLADTPQ